MRARSRSVFVLLVASMFDCAAAPDAPARLELLESLEPLVAGARPLPPATAEGFHLTTTRAASSSWAGEVIAVDVPAAADGPIRVGVAGLGEALVVRRLGGRPVKARVDGHALRYDGAAEGVDAIVFARDAEIEELFVVWKEVPLGYMLDLPKGWTAAVRDASAISIASSDGAARLTLRAAKAWDATGAPAAVRVATSGASGRVEVTFALDPGTALPAIVDPSWSAGTPPIRIRAGHTATLVGTGAIFVAGGEGTASASTEIVDVYLGRVLAGPSLLTARSAHSATVLASGKVLLAGGTGVSSAELFDPLTRTLAPTGSMSRARAGHTALRLTSGKVLVVGGAGADDATAEIYDPATGTFSPAADRTSTRSGGSSVTLAMGKVLFVDDRDGPFLHAEIFDPEAGTWSTPLSQPPGAARAARSLTRLRGGRVLVATTSVCAAVSEPFCEGATSLFDPAGAGTFTDGPEFIHGRPGAGVALLPGSQVVFTGGPPSETITSAERYEDPSAARLVDDGAMPAAHPRPTATLVPGGDVFVIGGSQATVSLRIGVGRFRPTGSMAAVREAHVAVRLHDGTALLTGGSQLVSLNKTVAAAETYDPSSGAFTTIAAMSTPRAQHTMTVLASGKVLVAGGARLAFGSPEEFLATAEIYDPEAPPSSRFRTIASMTAARAEHAATLLPSGHVLVTGGCTERSHPTQPCTHRLTSAELFDPATETFQPLPPMNAARSAHGAVLLPTGKVLVVGDDSADLFDPLSRTFLAASPPGGAREGSTAHVLANGRVFVAGGPTLAADIYDPATDTWSFSSTIPLQRPGMVWTPLPDGRLLSYGGRLPVDGLVDAAFLFDPLGTTTGASTKAGEGGTAYPTAVLLGSGEVLVSGGTPCWGVCPDGPGAKATVFDDGAPASARPVLAQAPAKVVPGARVTLAGAGFAFGPESSSGTTSSSATNHPLAFWVADAGDAVLQGTIVDFTNTSATWLVPATALYGHGQLFVGVGGVLSRGRPVEIAAAPTAVTCAFDAECETGFCVDSVCCDRRCDGKCEGCSAKRKTSGADGECGPVPPGKDIAGRCFSQLGQGCADGQECVTGFCAGGVCCDSSCTGACQACNLEARLGRCSPINEGACGAVCDGDQTLKKVGAPDLDCAPFKCEADRCKTACASVRDCAAPFVCSLDGQCVAPPALSAGEDAVCGCRAVGAGSAKSRSVASFGAVLAIVVVAARRRRRAASKFS